MGSQDLHFDFGEAALSGMVKRVSRSKQATRLMLCIRKSSRFVAFSPHPASGQGFGIGMSELGG
jgi:hypothetical protein